MLYYIYSVLLVYLISGITYAGILTFKPTALQNIYVRSVAAISSLYTGIGIPTVIFFLIKDMQIFADWLSRVVYVLQHLGVSI